MKNNISIALYKDSKRDELEKLLNDFSEEVYGKRMSNIDEFVDNHWAIYLAIKDDKVIGFSSYTYNTYYGLREPNIGNDYIYIDKRYRRSKAMHLLSVQTGNIAKHTGLPIEHYYVEDSKSMSFIGRLKGNKIYNTYEFTAENIIREADRLKSKIFN